MASRRFSALPTPGQAGPQKRYRFSNRSWSRRPRWGVLFEETFTCLSLAAAYMLDGRDDNEGGIAERSVSSGPRQHKQRGARRVGALAARRDGLTAGSLDLAAAQAHYGTALTLAAPRVMHPSSPTATSGSACSTVAPATRRRLRST